MDSESPKLTAAAKKGGIRRRHAKGNQAPAAPVELPYFVQNCASSMPPNVPNVLRSISCRTVPSRLPEGFDGSGGAALGIAGAAVGRSQVVWFVVALWKYSCGDKIWVPTRG